MATSPKKTSVTVDPLPLEPLQGNPNHPANDLLDQIELMAAHGHTELRATITDLVRKIREVL